MKKANVVFVHKKNEKHTVLTLKWLGEGGGRGGGAERGVNLIFPCGLLKRVSFKDRVKPWFFDTFNTIISHIFSENFIEISEVVQNIRRISQSILAIFINFHLGFGFFYISLLQRN